MEFSELVLFSSISLQHHLLLVAAKAHTRSSHKFYHKSGTNALNSTPHDDEGTHGRFAEIRHTTTA